MLQYPAPTPYLITRNTQLQLRPHFTWEIKDLCVARKEFSLGTPLPDRRLGRSENQISIWAL